MVEAIATGHRGIADWVTPDGTADLALASAGRAVSHRDTHPFGHLAKRS